MNTNDLEEGIIKSLTILCKEIYPLRLSNSEWTKRIKSRICELGMTNGNRICTSGFKDEHDREWLYDLTWYTNDEENRLVEINLVMESEWNRNYNDIKYDFEKLLQARSHHRLMIFQGWEEDIISHFKNLTTAIECYKHSVPGDRYLLAGLNESTGEFNFHSVIKSN